MANLQTIGGGSWNFKSVHIFFYGPITKKDKKKSNNIFFKYSLTPLNFSKFEPDFVIDLVLCDLYLTPKSNR